MFKNLYEKMFYQGLRIRLIEEKIIELYPSDKIQSPVHLSIGQEAAAVGLCENLNNNDWIFINYRGHAFYLAKGGSLKKFFAELYGKKTGISGGKAGSMHLAHPSTGVIGASAVVATSIPHAVGSALANKINSSKRVIVSIFGDGAADQGVYHESLNFSSLFNLPILFYCENNGLAVHTSLENRQSFLIGEHAKAYGIKVFRIDDGYDFSKVYKVCKIAINYILRYKKPAYVEIKTFRYKEHVGPGDDLHENYRDKKLSNKWKKLDPLFNDIRLIKKFSSKINNEIEEAVNYAENSEYPSKSDLLKDII